MLIWAFLLLNKKFNLRVARQVYWIAKNRAYTNRHERKRNDKEITWQFFSTTTWPCSLSLSVREFEDFLSQSPSLTFYIYYTIKIFLRQIAAIFVKNRLFCNKYWSLRRRKNSNFFAMLHFQTRLFQHTKFPFKSVVSIWSGTADHERLAISLTRRSKGRPGVPPVERNREAPRGGGGWFRENTVIICGGGGAIPNFV